MGNIYDEIEPTLYRIGKPSSMNDTAMIELFARLSEKNARIFPDDYTGEDGLIYCAKCHTPKQSKIPYMDGERIVTHLCECQAKERDEQQRRTMMESKRLELAHKRNAAFPDSQYRDWTFDLDDGENAEASDICKRYARNWWSMYNANKGLLLYGTVGTGKSFLASCIVNEVLSKYYVPCLMTNMTRIASMVQKEKDPQAYLDTLNEYDLIVLDDLGAERSTPWMTELTQSFINSRYMSGKPIIVTTNLSKADFSKPENSDWERIISRLFDICYFVEVKHTDRRKSAFVRNRDEMRELLGLKEDGK